MLDNLKSVVLAATLAIGTTASIAAPVVLDTGTLQMGLNDDGRLVITNPNNPSSTVGFVGPQGDAISPGCYCEGWGAAANSISNWTYGEGPSTNGIVSALLTTTTASGAALSAQSVVVLANGLRVTHDYSSAANGSLFKVTINLTNTTADALSDVRYARTLDWDVTPGYFNDNFTTVYGGTPTGPGGKVLHTSVDPFAVPDPMSFRSQASNQNVENYEGDWGGYFVFGFGALDAGASVSFDTYIGANTSVAGLLADLSSVGVEAYSYTTGSEQGYAPAFGYGFTRIGLPPIQDVPEPSAIALCLVALAGVGVATRRRR